ncbi:Tim44 domain-containing protein [Acinetobacter brisouii]|uniref:Tim44 domain-containing protein n=1 Tax=Acinetobacter brisouii TaxID=396323 RepID=UPI00124C1D04|nr:Tim44-like domain-containing protein [Acinetobacter brisouii]
MNTRQRGLVATLLMATLLASPFVEAKRAGGGRSHGMTRSVAPSQSYQQRSPSYPTSPTPVTTQQQKSGSNLGKMVAAGAAGAAVGALATHALANDNNGNAASHPQQAQTEQKSGIPSWIWFILLAGIGFFIYRKLSAKKSNNTNPYAPNQNGTPFTGQPQTNSNNTNIFGQNVGGGYSHNLSPQTGFGGAYTNSGSQLPDGTEPAAFLRIARQRFNHIQSVNSASNIEEIRRYLTPELYNSMYQDIMANRDQDVAEFSNLNAMIADSATENGQYIISVRFTGTVSEDLNSIPQPFTEVWHFVKPVGSQQDWLVAGIQVEN